MSANKDAAITPSVQPKDDKSDKAIPKMSPMIISSEQHDNGKGKRLLSASPEPRPPKRQDTKITAPTSLSYKDLPTTHLLPPSHTTSTKLSLAYHTGSLFSAPPSTLLVHACNTQGAWGSGIALAFKQQYPNAYAIYHAFCTKEHSFKRGNPVPVGTTLLIPPVDGDKKHWIGCLFTSRRYGKAKDGVSEILRNTERALEGCLELARMAGADEISEVRMCRINSGKFGVPWERTEEVLKGVVVREGWTGRVQVWDPESV
jgi:ADP-ribose 1''-phosphate phosphatase